MFNAALLAGLGAASFPPVEAAATESPASETGLAEVPLASGATLTVERRGEVALFGINRPHIQNRIDPATSRALAKVYYDYDRDPSLRAAVLFPIPREKCSPWPRFAAEPDDGLPLLKPFKLASRNGRKGASD